MEKSQANPRHIYAILMVTYNRAQTLSRILSLISNYSWTFEHFIIIDNNSTDETAHVLKEYSDRSKYVVIHSNENIGHGAGIAMGLKYLVSNARDVEYIIFLEDDSIPAEELPAILIESILKSGFDFISSEGSRIKLGQRIKVKPVAGKILKADFCLLDGAVLRYQVVKKIGYPMEDWFMMVDDYEYGYRIRKHGFSMGVISNPGHEILHYGGAGGFTHATLWRGYYQMRNHVFFLKRHFTLFHLVDFLILQGKRFVGGLYPPDRLIRTRLKWTGLWHGIIGKKGRTLDPQTLKFIH